MFNKKYVSVTKVMNSVHHMCLRACDVTAKHSPDVLLLGIGHSRSGELLKTKHTVDLFAQAFVQTGSAQKSIGLLLQGPARHVCKLSVVPCGYGKRSDLYSINSDLCSNNPICVGF